jgi:predicted dinucleotide-binding enzyme
MVADSRNALMLQAKEKGIKNFRILNKAELQEVLVPGIPSEKIDQVVATAVARWRSGWGTKKSLDTKV